jgi:hypothetical protein
MVVQLLFFIVRAGVNIAAVGSLVSRCRSAHKAGSAVYKEGLQHPIDCLVLTDVPLQGTLTSCSFKG